MSRFDAGAAPSLPKPGRTLWGVMIAIFAVWLMFSVALTWAGVSPEVFQLFCGNTERILHGEVWRLFTAPLLHLPSVLALLMVMLGFYFLTPTLEQQWGGARLLRFLIVSSLVAYLFQMGFDLLLPRSVTARLIPEYWFSSTPALEAVAIAWALTFRGQTVRVMFVIPVTSTGLIVFVVAVSLLYLVTGEMTSSGLIAPFGGMACGWLLGGSTPSPLRKAWLRLRMKRLEREVATQKQQRQKRVASSGLRVIEGGNDDDDDKHDDDDDPKRLLN
jgi:membrane associated rhomboid family serine protease